ncbi:MAG TPA: M13 family metallopeptidase [Fluviicola sp.]|nr:M13 family metallopeptidase [Fluviicola sp.]
MKTIYTIVPAAVILLAACTPKPDVTPDATVGTSSGSANDNSTTISLGYMDKTVKPQDDFFLFANGTWCRENPVPSDESRWGSFNELEKRNKTTLLGILKTAAGNTGTKGTQDQILGDYFKSYIDMEKRNRTGWTPLKERLEVIKNIKSREEIAKIVAEQHKVGINSLFGFGVGQDLKDVSKNISYLGQGGLGLPNRDYYFQENKQKERDAYIIYIRDLFRLTGEKEDVAAKRADRVFQFEKRLADSMMAPADLRIPEKTYNKYGFRAAKKLFNSFDFETYLSLVGSQSFDTVIVGQPAFLKQVNELIGELPMQDWIDYLTFKSMNHYAGMLDDQWVEVKFKFYQGVLSGKSEMKPISERAIDEITGSPIGELLGKAFVQVSYSENAQKRVNEMVDNLLASFRERIKMLDWMSADTKKEALTKLNAIGRKLGFPEEWRDFSKLDISTDYVTNVDNCAKYENEENFGKLYKPVNRKEWGMPAHLVNAYYHPLLNEIAFPAGIMQPPFFDEKAEDAVNYGRIGMVIGHEFTHGFDDSGSKFAADGTFNNWWTESDRTSFESRTKILGETFSGFCPVEGHCVNPDLTMGENIADLGGLTMAYYAYQRTEEFKSGKLRQGYTPAQRFFIAYAQLWKINYTDAELKNRIANDPHSPGMYRVNGPLMNCPEFFEAFNVKEGDKMRNSADKVSKIW